MDFPEKPPRPLTPTLITKGADAGKTDQQLYDEIFDTDPSEYFKQRAAVHGIDVSGMNVGMDFGSGDSRTVVQQHPLTPKTPDGDTRH